MVILTLIISLIALGCSCAMLLVCISKHKKDVVLPQQHTEQSTEPQTHVEEENNHPAVQQNVEPIDEHPFSHNEAKGVYVLNGNLEVTGSICCLKKGGEE